jgi:hypothetical protein
MKNLKFFIFSISFLGAIILANPVSADYTCSKTGSEPDISCPTGTANEILLYFHGLYNDRNYKESCDVFKTQLDSIRNSKPGVIGVHVNGGNPWSSHPADINSVLAKVDSECNVKGSLPIILAGHSDGGSAVRANANMANRIILLDATYGSVDAFTKNCSKITMIDGSSTKTGADVIVNACKNDTNFKYFPNQSSSISHFNTRNNLSQYYLMGTNIQNPNSANQTTGGDTGPNITMPNVENPFDKLQVKIPGMAKFSEAQVVQEGGKVKIYINWIAEYLVGFYRYAIGIIGIFAVVGMAIGGVIWIMSAGNPSMVGMGREWVMSSLLGLILALGSYIILNSINSEFVNFKPISLLYVEKIDLPDYGDSAGPDSGVAASQGKNYTGNGLGQIPCPSGITDIRQLADYYTSQVSVYYSQSLRGSCSGGKCYLDCSSFAQLLAICGKLRGVSGEGRTINLFVNSTNNRQVLPKNNSDFINNPDKYLRPGDLVGYNTNGKGHVLTYIGNSQMVESGGGSQRSVIKQLAGIKIVDFKKRIQGYGSTPLYYINR